METVQSSKTATINVLPAPLKTPTITWSNPADITAGTALGSEQLNAIATDPNTGTQYLEPLSIIQQQELYLM